MDRKADMARLLRPCVHQLLGAGSRNVVTGRGGSLIYYPTNEVPHGAHTCLLVNAVREPLPGLSSDTL
ncbi:hypothetical protein E2C01_021911 [Portunus trituberculatus]|uniref:Uncharacterized protein n=1 Tax=Portunus trituberculatus TaxID=210409 RepID=A0A5B7E3V3_PORTR|nr:hypothetical protein [Portunus trituberculatus]